MSNSRVQYKRDFLYKAVISSLGVLACAALVLLTPGRFREY